MIGWVQMAARELDGGEEEDDAEGSQCGENREPVCSEDSEASGDDDSQSGENIGEDADLQDAGTEPPDDAVLPAASERRRVRKLPFGIVVEGRRASVDVSSDEDSDASNAPVDRSRGAFLAWREQKRQDLQRQMSGAKDQLAESGDRSEEGAGTHSDGCLPPTTSANSATGGPSYTGVGPPPSTSEDEMREDDSDCSVSSMDAATVDRSRRAFEEWISRKRRAFAKRQARDASDDDACPQAAEPTSTAHAAAARWAASKTGSKTGGERRERSRNTPSRRKRGRSCERAMPSDAASCWWHSIL
mmetsp:Transcript_22820/g.63920  ORF Transcript_22820/g.63920 Transcript_22820/m.63920 type:complete len:302 (+) Transcript_22820:491-1396(+)